MTNQTQVSADLSEGTMTPADWLRACSAWLDFPDMKATVREHLEEIADELDAAQADMSGKTVMSEEAFRELHGKAERLSALEADARRYRYLRDHCSSHYPMTHEQPAEWSIGWEFQQRTPDEAVGTFDTWIDADIAWMEDQEALLTKEQTRG